MKDDDVMVKQAAERLIGLYGQRFGGKNEGRYRISAKNLRRLCQRRRLSDECRRNLAEEMFENGFVLIDLETFFAVTRASTFTNYRRVGDALVVGDAEREASVR